MNILENQVVDLNYLVDSPIAPITPSASMNTQQQRMNSDDAESPAGHEGGKKRKNNEDGSANGNAQTRAKRNRYISIAWYVIL